MDDNTVKRINLFLKVKHHTYDEETRQETIEQFQEDCKNHEGQTADYDTFKIWHTSMFELDDEVEDTRSEIEELSETSEAFTPFKRRTETRSNQLLASAIHETLSPIRDQMSSMYESFSQSNDRTMEENARTMANMSTVLASQAEKDTTVFEESGNFREWKKNFFNTRQALTEEQLYSDLEQCVSPSIWMLIQMQGTRDLQEIMDSLEGAYARTEDELVIMRTITKNRRAKTREEIRNRFNDLTRAYSQLSEHAKQYLPSLQITLFNALPDTQAEKAMRIENLITMSPMEMIQVIVNLYERKNNNGEQKTGYNKHVSSLTFKSKSSLFTPTLSVNGEMKRVELDSRAECNVIDDTFCVNES